MTRRPSVKTNEPDNGNEAQAQNHEKNEHFAETRGSKEENSEHQERHSVKSNIKKTSSTLKKPETVTTSHQRTS